MARFYVGQPVICIDDRPNSWLDRHYPHVRWVVRGQRYVIRANIVADISGVKTFVLLREISNGKVVWGDGKLRESAFWEERFEPATDISVLDEIRMDVDVFVGDEIEIARPAPVRKKEKVE